MSITLNSHYQIKANLKVKRTTKVIYYNYIIDNHTKQNRTKDKVYTNLSFLLHQIFGTWAFFLTYFYIPINVISFDTVDFTECDPMLRITTLWFSESISPLSETDDVVHNVFLKVQYVKNCDVIHIAPYKMYQELYLFQNETYILYS